MTKSEMRKARLLEMLKPNGRIGVSAAADAFSVSEATIRRLFAQLEREGRVIRTHGGVQLAPHMNVDYSYRLSATHRIKEKTRIGNAAAQMIQSKDRIFLDSGTTVLKLAEALSIRLQSGELDNVLVLTNSLSYIDILAPHCRVILIGGEIRTDRNDVCGSVAEKNLQMFYVDRTFLGADGIALPDGFMATDERTAKMNEIVIERTKESYVLADSEKLGVASFIRYASLEQVNVLITDTGAGEEALTELRATGLAVHTV
jgi:DeoR/GlpR family transcriptional regulator of sugar metabolism